MKAGCSCITHPSATKYVQKQASKHTPFDLNVLSTPPAFILSQDRTLEIIVSKPLSRSPSSLGSPRALRLALFGSNLKSELLYSALFIVLIELYFFISSAVFSNCLFAFRSSLPALQPQLSELTSWYFLVLVVQFSLSALPLSRTAQLFYHIGLEKSTLNLTKFCTNRPLYIRYAMYILHTRSQ